MKIPTYNRPLLLSVFILISLSKLLADPFTPKSISNQDYVLKLVPTAFKDKQALKVAALGSGLTLVALSLDQSFTDYLGDKKFMPDWMASTGDHYISQKWFLAALPVTFLINKDGDWENIRYAGAAIGGTGIITYALKHIFHKTRPNGDDLSFPSGHTSFSFSTAVVVHQLYGTPLSIPFWAMALITSLSRINDKSHYPSDVIFGATLGICIPLALYNTEKKYTLNISNNQQISLQYYF